jgi:hypothetical protein
VNRSPALTHLDHRVLGELRPDRGTRARVIAGRLSNITTGYDEVRGILRGLEHLGYVTGVGGWWRLLDRGSLSRNGPPRQVAG